MLNTLPKSAIFGHRGASAHAPENTLAAFELAYEQGANGIELDVKLSADGIPVVFHDPTLDRTTNGSGALVDFDLAALKELDAGGGEKIPTLAEVFESVGQKLFINIELTNYTTPNDALVEEVLAVINDHDMQDRILFSSFHAHTLKKAADLAPNIPRGLLATYMPRGLYARWIRFRSPLYQTIHPCYVNLSKRMCKKAHQRGQRVITWTVNSPAKMQKYAKWGVDGIITDDPKLAVETLRSTS